MGESAMVKPHKTLPKWAPWLIGYLCTLLFAVGLVYFWRVVFSLGALPMAPLALGVGAVATLLYAAFALLCRYCKDRLCFKAAGCVFLLGLLFCFATAPLQVPDESDYFLRAQTLSQGHLTADYHRDYPRDVKLLYHHFPAYQNHTLLYEQGQLAPARFAAYRKALVQSTTPEAINAPLQFQTLPFLPQALGIALARLLGFSALGQLYGARIANVLLYSVLCYFTFKNCAKYRGVFFAFCLLPLSLFIAASAGRDGIMLGLCFWMLSFFCKSEVTTRDICLFGLACLYISVLKPMNIVLAALLLLIPEERWKSKLHPWAVTGILAAVGVAGYMLSGAISGPDGPLAVGFPPREEWQSSGGGQAVDAMGQLVFVLRHFPRFCAVTLQSLYESNGFLFDLGTFGWMDLPIPLVGGLSLLSLSASSALGIQQKDTSKNTTVLALTLAAVLYACAILLGMYLLQSDYQAIRIAALQPRYFLPSFLMLFMVANILLGKAVRPRLQGPGSAARTEGITLYIAAAVALFSAILLLQNSFIGQWIPKSTGGWQLVNLFGWQ